MKPFWVCVGLAFLCGFGGLFLLPVPSSYTWQPSEPERLAHYGLVALIVAGVWAICFRTQLERCRLSLLSLFVLTLMEGAFFALMKFFRH
jgi:hypothetical protein